VNIIDDAFAGHSINRLIGNPKEACGERFRDQPCRGPHVLSAEKVGHLVMAQNGAYSRAENL
jgi:hypothetical protein